MHAPCVCVSLLCRMDACMEGGGGRGPAARMCKVTGGPAAAALRAPASVTPHRLLQRVRPSEHASPFCGTVGRRGCASRLQMPKRTQRVHMGRDAALKARKLTPPWLAKGD